MVTLENWRERMSEDMRLRDFRPRTQEGYALAVRQFLDRMQKPPEALSDEDVRSYFLYLREDKKLAPSSINIAVHALRFFFVHTLQRDWPVFGLLRVHKPRMLPVVLSPGEVRAVLSAVRHPVRRILHRAERACSWAYRTAASQERNTLCQRPARASASNSRTAIDATNTTTSPPITFSRLRAHQTAPLRRVKSPVPDPTQSHSAFPSGFVQQAL